MTGEHFTDIWFRDKISTFHILTSLNFHFAISSFWKWKCDFADFVGCGKNDDDWRDEGQTTSADGDFPLAILQPCALYFSARKIVFVQQEKSDFLPEPIDLFHSAGKTENNWILWTNASIRGGMLDRDKLFYSLVKKWKWKPSLEVEGYCLSTLTISSLYER